RASLCRALHRKAWRMATLRSGTAMEKVTCGVLAFLLAFAICSRELVAWGDVGQLDLTALLGASGDPRPSLTATAEELGRMATWPDHMPGGKGTPAPWHFIGLRAVREPPTRSTTLAGRRSFASSYSRLACNSRLC